MTRTFTLKELGRNLQKANLALSRHRRIAKGEETDTIKEIKKIISNIELEIASRTNPSNAVRNALPKKVQRAQGTLNPVGYVEENS